MTLPTGTTRLAPSPTGALHLGNARTFLVNWSIARQRGWRITLRIDDLEGPRIKPGADRQVILDLQWLGLQWDGEPMHQSSKTSLYAEALRRLGEAGYVYPCVCTRSEIEARGVRLEPDGSPRYPGTCRGRFASEDQAWAETGRAASIRFAISPVEIAFRDECLGRVSFAMGSDLGDFIVRKADGEFGYHLANVVDDAAAGVTHVVRGEDLLASAPRQILLYKALQLESRLPQYMHLPLVIGLDGRKLAKRHGDTRLSQLRDEGITAGQVRALLARWSGLEPAGEECTIGQWVDQFDLERLPMSPVMYDDRQDRPRPLTTRGGS